MHLKVLLPFEVFTDKTDVARLVVETHAGSMGILPHRLDCVAALAAGILSYQIPGQAEVFLAVDEGVMVKTGPDVLVSVRRAIQGTDLSQLRATIEKEFLTLNAQEKDVRSVMTKLETGLLRRMVAFNRG